MSCFRSHNTTENPFVREIRRYIGETVTIFTTSGGASGSGFTGVVMSVSNRFVRLLTQQGTPPANPLGNAGMGDIQGRRGLAGLGNIGNIGSLGIGQNNNFMTGSVCDIPVNRITAFVHNAE